MKNARLAAFEILNRIFKENAYSNILLEQTLCDFNGKDKAFITGLVYGITERRITLDYLLEQHLKSKPKNKVRLLFYIGIYQLYFMEKVPSSAAINETLKLADQVGCGYYKSLLNAVLHKLDNTRISIDAIEDVSVRYSCPPHLVAMLTKMYGADKTQEVLACLNEKPPVFAVPNTQYVSAEELAYELTAENIACEAEGSLVRISGAFDVAACRAFRNGLFYIEDKSAYEAACLLSPKAGEVVLDMCAAPGGKTFTLAQQMPQATVYAYDLHPHRVALIREGAARLGLKNIKTAVNDACQVNTAIPPADKILCDVPCSGFGIMRRKPEIRYKDLDSVKALPQLQAQILQTSAQYLKKGGYLLYATCTLNKRENEQVAERFLKENPSFTLQEMKTVFPDKYGGDGFFWALMKKEL